MVGFKDASRGFPLHQTLKLLRWTADAKAKGKTVPLTVNCWLSPGAGNSFTATIEYEADAAQLAGDALTDVVISVPFPGSEPDVAGFDEPIYTVHGRRLQWTIPRIDEACDSGSLDFTVEGESENDFFPISVQFHKLQQFCAVGVTKVVRVDDESEVKYGKQAQTAVENYTIV
jgi:hypothetical protein